MPGATTRQRRMVTHGGARPAMAVAILMAWLVAGPAAWAQVTPRLVISDVDQPVRLVAPPGDPRLYVVEQTGRVRVFDRNGLDLGVFLDLSGRFPATGERGLLGLAFAPDYAISGRLYINHTDGAGDTRLVRYLVSSDPLRADPASGDTLLTVDQPFSNHNGGHLEFGPDGMLYLGLGDGGSAGDPGNRAQDGQSLLGKLLRLDVSGPAYVPAPGNPFLASPPRDEIWATGLRNPWCFSFDRLTGDLYIADVGQSALEEIDIAPQGAGGRNYGWRLMEGEACYNPGSGCDTGSLTLPVHQYTHGGTPFRCSISGGYVYRGQAIPSLAGTYLFADYCSCQIWGLTWNAGSGTATVADWTAALTPTRGYTSISAFGQDSAGELYVLDHGGGRIFRIEPLTTGAGPPTAPLRLRQNVPNPFNPRTEIAWSAVPGGGAVRLDVYGSDGRLVRHLSGGDSPELPQRATWDGTDEHGRAVPAGVYFCRLSQGAERRARKMTLLK